MRIPMWTQLLDEGGNWLGKVARLTCRHSAQSRNVAQLLKVIIGFFQKVCNDGHNLYDKYAECLEFAVF